ncbi:MAG: efflux RND transporter permease subunit [Deltaproteobacteria bacterium]|nr:efflux RND transporter permease subunit [Deltaproteobacteria bacterium]
MIERIVGASARAPFLAVLFALVIACAGVWSYRALDIEAYPNPVPPLVEVIAQPEGMSAEDVERYVTVPLEIALAGIPGLEHTRSQSLFGLADVKCYFRHGTSYEAARQEVLNRLFTAQLPDGVRAEISPWNAIGEVFRYELQGKGYGLRDLKTAQDWIMERQLKQVPGVVDVVSFGGQTKQYQVNVDPFRLRAYGVNLDALLDAIRSSNQNVGGQRLSLGEQAYTIRGVGLLRSVHDIEAIVIAARGGVPIRVRDVATVEIGGAPRLGIVGHDERDDVVQGTVLMRYGAETPRTLEAIRDRLRHIRENHLLPPGMEVVPYYDRGDLVATTTHTVIENVVVGMVLVTIVLVLFLGHVRAALVTAINVPLALLAAFCGMVATGTSANLLSIGAVDFGIVVDSTVIVMESVFHFLGSRGQGTIEERIQRGAAQVARPLGFATLIIAVAFLPLFTLTGVAGVIFSPMAHTYAFAIGAALILALTVTPALTARLVPATADEKPSAAARWAKWLYRPVFDLGARRPRVALLVGLAPVALGIALFGALGGEFMPKLEEGNLWIRATLPPSVSFEQSSSYVARMRAILRGCPPDGAPCEEGSRAHPEVLTVVSQLGRPDDGTDVAGFHDIELFAPLRPSSEWRRGLTKAKLTEQLSKELTDAFPGVGFNFSQMISDNVEEATSGVKGENSIKVFGPDVVQNERTAERIVEVVGQVSGVQDLGLVRSSGQPSIKITPDRQACARYGLNTGNVAAVIQAAIGGKAATQVFEGDRRFDLTVRWAAPYRESIEAIKELMIFAPDGTPVPLGQIAQVAIEDSPSVVFREDHARYTPIKFSVRGRDLEGTVAEARAKVAAEVQRGTTHLAWSGAIDQLREAQHRLLYIVPATLLLVAILVYVSVENVVSTLVVLLNVPVACAGGVIALFVAHLDFSVSAAMGFISVFGIAIQDAMLVVTHFRGLRGSRGSTPPVTIEEAALEASVTRLRPVLMTTLVALFGLLPAALSRGIGSETQRPLAVVVVGGAIALAVVARVVQLPALVLAHRAQEAWRARRGRSPRASSLSQ